MALRFRPPGQLDDVRVEAGSISAAEREVTGRVFVLDDKGRPTPTPLRLGITDGRVTEVLAGDLREGQPVITGTRPAIGSRGRRPHY